MAEVDGRTARRDRNREAVLDAVLDLFREDAMFPGPAQVAERSGVSRRSVQRYFEDDDALIRAAMARNLERITPFLVVDDPGVGPLAERVERMVAARLRLHEVAAPMVRAALLRVRSNALIRERLHENRARLRDQVEAMFAPELDALDAAARREVLAGADVLLGFESMEHLRAERGLSTAEAARVLVRAVGAVVGDRRPGGTGAPPPA